MFNQFNHFPRNEPKNKENTRPTCKSCGTDAIGRDHEHEDTDEAESMTRYECMFCGHSFSIKDHYKLRIPK